MRFHHSTRRRTTRFSQGPGGATAAGSSAGGRGGLQASRWAQLSYCRLTNIHFNRRHQVEPPAEMQHLQSGGCGKQHEWQPSERVASDNDSSYGTLIAQNGSKGAPKNLNSSNLGEASNKNNINNDYNQSGAAASKELELQLERSLNLNGISAAALASNGGCGALGSSVVGNEQQLEASLCDTPQSLAQNSAAQNGAATCSSIAQDNVASEPQAIVVETAANNGNAQLGFTQTKQNNHTKVDIESAREKLIAQVEKHPFWSNKAAKRMRLVDVCERQIYIYELVSYCERRDLEWRYEPFRGCLVGAKGAPASVTRCSGGTSLPIGAAPFQERARLASSASSQLSRQRSANTTNSAVATNSDLLANNELCASPPMSDTHTGLLASLHPMSSVSQPSSPPQELEDYDNQLKQEQEQELLQQQVLARQHQFTYSLGPEARACTAVDARRYSLIRRSCSSANSSPVHQGQQMGAQRHLPSTPLVSTSDQLAATQTPISGAGVGLQAPLSTSTSCPVERPLPSAQFVWSIAPPERHRPALFAPSVHTIEMPNSSFVKRCHGCSGRGRLKCSSCYGVGYEVCISCSGKGTQRHLSGRFELASSSQVSAGSGARHQCAESTSPWSEPGDSSAGAFSSAVTSRRYDGEQGGITQSSSASWQTESCHNCHGAGQKRCWICAGRAYQTCTACAGTGQLRCYLNLNITWLNHRDECVLNNSDAIIPRERLKLCSGLLLYDQIGVRLLPLECSLSVYAADLSASTSHHHHHHHHHRAHNQTKRAARSPDGTTMAIGAQQSPTGAHAQHQVRQDTASLHLDQMSQLSQLIKPSELNQLHSVSSKLLEKHQLTYTKQERLVRQRHTVTQIECFIVNWEWKRRRGHFVIYGDERKVYIAKYPFKSICSIT